MAEKDYTLFYVYEHWRPDKNLCFYVGKGKGKRGHDVRRKPLYHKHIVAKLVRLGMRVDVRIVKDGLTEKEALALEIKRIAFWKSAGVVLTNQTNGGEGISGYVHSKESKAKISISSKAVHARPEVKAKLSAVAKARRLSPEVRANTSASVKSAMARPEVKARHREAMIAVLARPEVKAKRRALLARPEVQEKIKLGLRLAFAKPEFKARHSVIMKSVLANPEIKEKHRTAIKAAWVRRRNLQIEKEQTTCPIK